MNSEDRVLAALKALAQEDRECEAPARVEPRLRAAFRRKHTIRQWRFASAMAVAVVAMAVMVVVGVAARGRRPAQPPVGVAVAEPAAREATISPGREPARPVPAMQAARSTAPREVATEFFPLVDVAPPFESGELLRVIVPASTMRSVGLPVREDRWAEPVQADILVGQEGIARAIRFVRVEP